MRLRAAGFFAAVARLLDFADVRAVDFAAAGFRAVDVLALLVVERLAVRFFAGARFVAVVLVDLAAPLSSSGHLPDITFCAASATASAMSEPSLVALDITDFAALSAVSAASIPASLIALRALGLALIAAAAAANPAASISLLIAALASLSAVDLLEDFVDRVRLVDFAIANLLRVAH